MQNQSPIKLYYVSAPAGSGKTHGLTRHAATLAASDNRKVIIAQPTTELIRQTAADLRALKPELAVTTIYKVKLSIGVQSGPPIGAQKGPPLRCEGRLILGAGFALLAA